MILLFATLLIGSWRQPVAPIDQISTRRAHFGELSTDAGIKPADNAWCYGMPKNWPGCNNGY